MANFSGKWKMTNISDCFNIGSIVACRTCYQKNIEGEVLAFDAQTKILILKCALNDGRKNVCDINFVNLNFVSDVQVIKEVTTAPPTPHSLSIHLLKNRLKNNVENKQHLINSLKSGGSPEGQKLYLTISKTLSHVKWVGSDIVVDDVRITPPYKTENIIGTNDYVRKVVEKHLEDAQSAKKKIQTTNNSISVNNSSNHSSSHDCATSSP